MTSALTPDGIPSPKRGPWRTARGLAATLSLSVVLVLRRIAELGVVRLAPGSVRTGVSPTLPGVTVTGPMPVGSPTFNNTLYGTNFDLSQVGYEKSQFFLSGTAHSYVPVKPLTSDGKWNDHDRCERAVHDTDSRLPSDRPEEVQRDGRGRVAQRERRDGRQP